jgi:NTE family protein
MSAIFLKDVIQPYQDELDEIKIDLKRVSNLRTKYNGEQIAFVDIVLEGGGVKGVAVSGALYALEYLGIRYRKIAGTSAGAMNAAFLAAAANHIADKKVEKLANVVLNMNLLKFVDGGRGAEAFVQAIMNEDKNLINRLNKFISFTRNIDRVLKNFGLNPGNSIQQWLFRTLSNVNHHKPLTVADLKMKMQNGPKTIKGDLKIITADITNRRMVVFPKQLDLYFQNPNDILISDIVRASLSIPVFFEPFYLKDFNNVKGYQESDNLIVNDKTMFVDGALVSNFPLGIFDTEKNKVPKCPTFGILFDTQNESESHEINTIIDFGLALIDTMNDYGDRNYIFRRDAASRIIKISNIVNDKPIKTMYFNLSRDEIIGLFGNGVRAAIEFIKQWDFKDYIKHVREP